MTESVPVCSSPIRGGNTISPARKWCFTLNNYCNSDIENLCSKLSSVARYLFTKEIGQSGTPHLQLSLIHI